MLTCVTLMISIKLGLCWLPKGPSWIHMNPWLKIAPVLLLVRHCFGKGSWCSPYLLQLINPSPDLWLGCAFWYPSRGEPSFQVIIPLGEFWVRQIDIFNFGSLCWIILVNPECQFIFHWPKKIKAESQVSAQIYWIRVCILPKLQVICLLLQAWETAPRAVVLIQPEAGIR